MASEFYGFEASVAEGKTVWMVVPAKSVIVYLLSTGQVAFSLAGQDTQTPVNEFESLEDAKSASIWLRAKQKALPVAAPDNKPT